MAYEEFPDEFEILKGSLENEDFDRSESVLLMILQKRPDFAQAKLDLEKVRGKLGSISNYEFRVRAFLDQEENDTAKQILAEAQSKFKKNKKIAKLVDFVKSRLGGGAEAAAAAAAQASNAVAPNALPNLDTMSEDGTSKEEMTRIREALAAVKKDDTKDKKGLMPADLVTKNRTVAKPNYSAGVPAEAAKPAEAKPAGGATPMGAAGIPGAPVPGEKRAPSAEAEAMRSQKQAMSMAQKLDAILISILAVVLLAVLAVFALSMSNASNAAVAPVPMNPAALQPYQYNLDKFASMDEGKKNLFISQIIEAPAANFAGKTDEVESLYAEFVKRQEDPVVQKRIQEIYKWRIEMRRANQQRTPVDKNAIGQKQWKPADFPPKYGVAGLQGKELTLLGMGLGVAVVPGVLLGLILAYCRLPFANRLFQFVWEFWYAFPMIALLYLGLIGLAPRLGLKQPEMLGAVLMGLAMAPHVAFYSRQGFANIRDKKPPVRIGLSVVSVVSALLATAARFTGEGLLVIGLANLTGAGDFAKPVETIGREMLVAMQQLLTSPPFGIPQTSDAEVRYLVTQFLGFWLFLIAAVLAVLSQALQAAVAWEGLRGPEISESEAPDHPRQAPFALPNLISFGVGALMVTVMGVLFITCHVGAGGAQKAAEGWTSPLTQAAVGDVASSSMRLAIFAGIGAFLLAGVISLIPNMIISSRRSRAFLECIFRVPTALPPILLVLFAVDTARGMNLAPGSGVAMFFATVALAPLALVCIQSGLETYRNGPFVKNKQMQLPAAAWLNGARVFEILGVLFFMMAVVAGSYTLVFAFGADVGRPDPNFPALPTHLFYALQNRGLTSGPAYAFYSQLFQQVLLFAGIAFVCRLIAEALCRVSLAKRG